MTDGKTARVVVVGAGHGGGNMVSFLRQAGHEGPIVMIGAETVPPYHRPPLSKAYLKGEATEESLKLRADSFYAEKNITLRLGETVTGIDRKHRRVHLADGSEEAYDKLVLATGSTPRRLSIPGSDLAGILELRCKTLMRHRAFDGRRGFVRTTQVHVRLDRHEFVGASPVLFWTVLRHFFALYANVNQLVECSFETLDIKGGDGDWPAMGGARWII